MPSILDDMFADICASKRDGSITILHDKAFDDELLELVCDADNGELLFKFANKEQLYGRPLLDEFAPFFAEAKTVTLLHIDMATKKPLGGMEVPLVLKGAENLGLTK